MSDPVAAGATATRIVRANLKIKTAAENDEVTRPAPASAPKKAASKSRREEPLRGGRRAQTAFPAELDLRSNGYAPSR